MYKPGHGVAEPTKDKNDIVQVCAGFNHSMALSKSGKVYSWGYSGKGLLGRMIDPSTKFLSLPLPVGHGL